MILPMFLRSYTLFVLHQDRKVDFFSDLQSDYIVPKNCKIKLQTWYYG